MFQPRAGGAGHRTTRPSGSALDGVASYDPLSKTADIIVDGSGAQQVYYASNASLHNASILASAAAPDGYYIGGLTHSGDARDDSFVDFVVDVPTARSYTMTVDYANPGSSTGTLGLAYDGGAWQTLSFPATGSGWAATSTTVSLAAGYNVIRLAMGSPFFAGGSGTVSLGYLQLG